VFDTPQSQALAFPFFDFAAPHDSPEGLAFEYTAAGFYLVIDVYHTDQLSKQAE